MSHGGGYQQYGGNPYGQDEATTGSGYGQSNPYGGTGTQYNTTNNSNPYTGGTGGGYDASSNPYNSTTTTTPSHALQPPAQLSQQPSQQPSTYSEVSDYSTPAYPTAQQPTQPLSQQDFLARIDGAKARINQLSNSIQSIAQTHQRLLSSPDSSASTQLESLVTDTQVRNTTIKDEIKFLERDASRESGHASFKRTQVEALKRTFKAQLEDFQREEADYSRRYRDAMARQYRIVNPDATEAEVDEAANADWGNEGIFQQALKTNRSAQGASVLGAVRARHNDIQRIEKTLGELAQLFTQLNEQVVYQEPMVQQTEQQTEQVVSDATEVNNHLDKGIKSARRARKLKWWTLFVVVLILAIIALALGLYFGLRKK